MRTAALWLIAIAMLILNYDVTSQLVRIADAVEKLEKASR